MQLSLWQQVKQTMCGFLDVYETLDRKEKAAGGNSAGPTASCPPETVWVVGLQRRFILCVYRTGRLCKHATLPQRSSDKSARWDVGCAAALRQSVCVRVCEAEDWRLMIPLRDESPPKCLTFPRIYVTTVARSSALSQCFAQVSQNRLSENTSSSGVQLLLPLQPSWA